MPDTLIAAAMSFKGGVSCEAFAWRGVAWRTRSIDRFSRGKASQSCRSCGRAVSVSECLSGLWCGDVSDKVSGRRRGRSLDTEQTNGKRRSTLTRTLETGRQKRQAPTSRAHDTRPTARTATGYACGHGQRHTQQRRVSSQSLASTVTCNYSCPGGATETRNHARICVPHSSAKTKNRRG